MTAWVAVRLGLAAGLGLVSLAVLELSIVAVVVTLLVFLSLPTLPSPSRRLAHAVLGVAALGSLVALSRFALEKAMAGIVQGGQQAALKSAIWRMREVVIAEDGARKRAVVDPDDDGVGSALFIGALAGLTPVRTGPPLDLPLLNYRFGELVETAIGPAVQVGSHLVIVCLPTEGGGFSAKPDAAVDNEQAERRFVAYAWPASTSPDIAGTIFVDEHERISLTSEPTFRGPHHPPSCTVALETPDDWEPWRDKAPRKTLPGDHR